MSEKLPAPLIALGQNNIGQLSQCNIDPSAISTRTLVYTYAPTTLILFTDPILAQYI